MRSLARSPAIRPSVAIGLFEGRVNAVPIAWQVFNLVSATVLPFFVLGNNLARRRRFHHDACPDMIFVSRPALWFQPAEVLSSRRLLPRCEIHSRGRGSTWVLIPRRRMCGPFSEPLDTLYQRGNEEPCGQFAMVAEVRNRAGYLVSAALWTAKVEGHQALPRGP